GGRARAGRRRERPQLSAHDRLLPPRKRARGPGHRDQSEGSPPPPARRQSQRPRLPAEMGRVRLRAVLREPQGDRLRQAHQHGGQHDRSGRAGSGARRAAAQSVRVPAAPSAVTAVNSPRQILLASLIGTAIEFFDFYIYATAAVLVFPRLFFPASDPTAGTPASLATFAIAFFARPIGAALFGHFGDRIGRKTTLGAALLAMGGSTGGICAPPAHPSIGVVARLLLALCRFGQGLGLGGEWGGAVLLAIENAPPDRRAWYGMFPQLGAPVGFVCSATIFLLISAWLTNDQFFRFGWRIPFLASAALVIVGLYVRLRIHETPVFRDAIERRERVTLPMGTVFGQYFGALVRGTVISIVTFELFYLMTVFCLNWGTSKLGYSRQQFLLIQLFGILFFA